MSFVKNTRSVEQRFYTQAWFVLGILLLCRLVANYFIPLNDSTEARYGEIARKMLETGNWITLQHDYGIPFWAKPPLSTWLSALAMKLFGVNEFAVRLPGLVLSLGVLWLVWDLVKKQSNLRVATLSVLVLSGTMYFFLDAGTVMTDPSLLFCTTLSLIAFWYAMAKQNKRWSYIFFVGLGLGLLAKGPIAIVLVGIPLFFWVLLGKRWLQLWHSFPWFKGVFLLGIIAFPWYVLAEMRTPGFLNYFILGEHVQRFLTPGWAGDRYGLAHYAPKGMIWLYAVVGIFPWSIVGGVGLLKGWKKIPAVFRDEDGWMSYVFLCMMAPLCFFTFASNIIYPYVFPSLPAFAIFFSEIWYRANDSLRHSRWIVSMSLLSGFLFLVATLLFALYPQKIAKTEKTTVATWSKQHPQLGSELIYWDDKTEFSAQFYSAGKAKAVHNIVGLCNLLSNQLENYLVVNVQDLKEIPANLLMQFKKIKAIQEKGRTFLLFRSPVMNCSRDMNFGH